MILAQLTILWILPLTFRFCKTKPFRFVRGVLNKHNLSLLQNQTLNLNKNIIFTGKFTKQSGHLETKVDDCEVLWGFKQKYKRLQKFKFMPSVEYDSNSFEPTKLGARKSPFCIKVNSYL